MKILVTGAGGLLGMHLTRIADRLGHEVVGLGHGDLDVTDAAAVDDAVSGARPDVLVQCAAYTAVDRAESEPELARAVNRDGTRHAAEAAARSGAKLVYPSTDYVFDGAQRTPYRPDDPPAPLGAYARSKLEGEEEALKAAGALVVRTSWLYGAGRGFVPAILRRAAAGERLRVVRDQEGRPTWAPHASEAILALLERGAEGIWHVAGGGTCTWLELAREALTAAGIEREVEGVSTAEYGAPAPRPAYSVLDLGATEEALERPMVHWREALVSYVRAEGLREASGVQG